jgi:hypothetical protein
MSTVRRTECVVHVDVGQSSQLPGESGIVALLAPVEPNVLQHEISPSTMRPTASAPRTDGRVDEHDVAADQPLERPSHGPQRVLRVRLALGPAEVAHQDHPRAVIDEIA